MDKLIKKINYRNSKKKRRKLKKLNQKISYKNAEKIAAWIFTSHTYN